MSDAPDSGAVERVTRRNLLMALGGAATGTAMLPAVATQAAQDRSPTADHRGLATPLHFSSATALARAIRTKRLGAEEVTRAFLARIRAVNPKIHAVVQVQWERAIELAREADARLMKGEPLGPLHGVPITIKDSLDTAGIVSTAGTLGRAQFVPARDAAVVARLKAAGAIVIGKSNTPELTLHGFSENLIYERTNNPYDVSRSPMGSSGGAGAIVAAGGSAFDIGSDTGGSIRIPAHVNGVCGLVPTAGRVARTGHIISYDTFDQALTTLGPLARYVEDLETILTVISGSDGIDPFAYDLPIGDSRATNVARLSLAFYVDNGSATPVASIDKALRQAAARFASTGARVEERRPPGTDEALALLWTILGGDGGYAVQRILSASGTIQVAPYLAGALGDPARFDKPMLSYRQFADFFVRWHDFKSRMTHFFADYDVMLCPASAIPAPTHDTDIKSLEATMLSYTAPFSIAGWPVAVVRAGTSEEGLPVGVQIVGKPFQEHVVLAVARFLEQEFGGFVAPEI
jgi:amidase